MDIRCVPASAADALRTLVADHGLANVTEALAAQQWAQGGIVAQRCAGHLIQAAHGVRDTLAEGR
ncbi:hypothetical protein [Caulobacter sp.]|uniref:hypothetical protein n=1 Tax=Caulobacter sp. TaxID=78 RepID=UPI0031E3DFA1